MRYGMSINKKFNEDGTIRRYPGNSIVSMINPNSREFDHLMYVNQQLQKRGIANKLIMLPPSSYHMTVIQGVNDQVREPSHWSRFKSLGASMEEMDAFFQEQYSKITPLRNIDMKLDHMQFNENDCRILVKPANDEVENKLVVFRDEVAQQFGVKLPNHHDYVFHITLAYLWKTFNQQEIQELQRLETEINQYLRQVEGVFSLPKAELVFYNDMFNFPTKRGGKQ